MMEREIRDEALVERIEEGGEVVFELDWDSGAPGMGADTEYVYESGGKFYYLSNSSGNYGPYDSLDELLTEHELLRITSAAEAIRCNSIPALDLLARSRVDEEVGEGFVVRVNGRDWVHLGGGRFEPVGEATGR